MLVHAVADTSSKLSALSTMLEQKCTVTSELLGRADTPRGRIDAIVVAADLGIVQNITALKAASGKLMRAPRRIFLIDGRGRLALVQAYALGATHVLTNPVSQVQLLAKLADGATAISSGEPGSTAREAASTGAASIAAIFSAVMSGAPVDVAGAKGAGGKIAESYRRKWSVRLAHDRSPAP